MTEHPIHRAQNNRGAAGAIVLITFVTFCAILQNDFVAWDDPQTITEHSALNPPTLSNMARFWNPREPIAGLYVPLTYTTWAAIAAIARDGAGTLHAWPFHLLSLIIHGIAAVTVFRILRRLALQDIPALMGAMLFALHPLQVESIAWASGLKDVLAGCLALLAIEQHLRRRVIASTVVFALAMLAKPSAASAIVIAALFDLLIERRAWRESIRALAPWIIIAIPLLTLARLSQDVQTLPHVALHRRPLVAIDAIGFYLTKLVAPINLGFDYGRAPARLSIGVAMIVPFVAAGLIALARSRHAMTAALVLLAGLMWNLGLAPFQFQFYSTVADHYMYLAMLGPAMLVAHLARQRLVILIVPIVLVMYAVQSFRQTLIWRSSDTLFTRAIEVNPRSTASHDVFGRVLGQRGDLNAAAEHFEASLAIQSDNAVALRNLALVEHRRGNIDTATDRLAHAVRVMERNGDDVAPDRRELVKWLAARGRWQETVEQLELAAARDPMNSDIARMLHTAREHASTMPSTATTSPLIK